MKKTMKLVVLLMTRAVLCSSFIGTTTTALAADKNPEEANAKAVFFYLKITPG